MRNHHQTDDTVQNLLKIDGEIHWSSYIYYNIWGLRGFMKVFKPSSPKAFGDGV
jgi:hypothetical protein